MATNKNIIMKQFNGTDYDTLYPKTKVEQVEGAYSQQQILSDSTKGLYGLENSAVPDAVFALTKTLVDNAQNSADSKAKIELGNYTGNGASAGKAKTLTFSFKPKVVIIAGPGDSYNMYYGFAVFMQGMVNSKIENVVSSIASDRNAYVYSYSFNLKWSGNSVSWTGASDWNAGYCLNENGTKYFYVAIG